MNTLDYNSIGKRAYATAQQKGWYSDGGPDFGTRIALIHSEVSEALEAWRDDKTCSEADLRLYLAYNARKDLGSRFFEKKIKGTVGDELSDVVIRCCETLAYFGVDATEMNHTFDFPEGIKSFGEAICYLHGCISCIVAPTNVLKSWKMRSIRDCAKCAEAIAERFNIDLASHIEAKLRYNTTRPHRHGGKKC